MQHYDFVVVGGGMVGAAIALGMGQKGYQVALIETHLPKEFDGDSLPDMRVSAISLGSEQLLRQLGAWSHIEATRLCVYRRLAVWEDERAYVEFDHNLAKQTHLGHIIENNLVQLGLHHKLADVPNVQIINHKIKRYDVTDLDVCVELENGQTIKGDYLIGADGAKSQVREHLGIGLTGWDYKQQVFALLIQRQAEQTDITWQQFHPSGPTAFLPLQDDYASLVWYLPAERIQSLRSLNSSALKQAVIDAFPRQLGEFEILNTASFPLRRQHASRYVSQRGILVGDAAHVINPLAGQGVNLGFKDVSALLDVLQLKNEGPCFIHNGLADYEKSRQRDNLMMMSAMDGFYAAFSNDIKPLKWARNAALKLVGQHLFIKQQVVKYALGV